MKSSSLLSNNHTKNGPPKIDKKIELSDHDLKWDKRGQTHSWSHILQDKSSTLDQCITESRNLSSLKTLTNIFTKKRGKDFSLIYRVEQKNICEVSQNLIDCFKNKTHRTYDESFSKRNRQTSPGRNYEFCSASVPMESCQNAHISERELELTGHFQLHTLAGAAACRIIATLMRSRIKARIIFELYLNEACVKSKQPMNRCGGLHNALSISRRVIFILAVRINYAIRNRSIYSCVKIWVTKPVHQCYFKHSGEESQEEPKKANCEHMNFTQASKYNDPNIGGFRNAPRMEGFLQVIHACIMNKAHHDLIEQDRITLMIVSVLPAKTGNLIKIAYLNAWRIEFQANYGKSPYWDSGNQNEADTFSKSIQNTIQFFKACEVKNITERAARTESIMKSRIEIFQQEFWSSFSNSQKGNSTSNAQSTEISVLTEEMEESAANIRNTTVKNVEINCMVVTENSNIRVLSTSNKKRQSSLLIINVSIPTRLLQSAPVTNIFKSYNIHFNSVRKKTIIRFQRSDGEKELQLPTTNFLHRQLTQFSQTDYDTANHQCCTCVLGAKNSAHRSRTPLSSNSSIGGIEEILNKHNISVVCRSAEFTVNFNIKGNLSNKIQSKNTWICDQKVTFIPERRQIIKKKNENAFPESSLKFRLNHYEQFQKSDEQCVIVFQHNAGLKSNNYHHKIYLDITQWTRTLKTKCSDFLNSKNRWFAHTKRAKTNSKLSIEDKRSAGGRSHFENILNETMADTKFIHSQSVILDCTMKDLVLSLDTTIGTVCGKLEISLPNILFVDLNSIFPDVNLSHVEEEWYKAIQRCRPRFITAIPSSLPYICIIRHSHHESSRGSYVCWKTRREQN